MPNQREQRMTISRRELKGEEQFLTGSYRPAGLVSGSFITNNETTTTRTTLKCKTAKLFGFFFSTFALFSDLLSFRSPKFSNNNESDSCHHEERLVLRQDVDEANRKQQFTEVLAVPQFAESKSLSVNFVFDILARPSLSSPLQLLCSLDILDVKCANK